VVTNFLSIGSSRVRIIPVVITEKTNNRSAPFVVIRTGVKSIYKTSPATVVMNDFTGHCLVESSKTCVKMISGLNIISNQVIEIKKYLLTFFILK